MVSEMKNLRFLNFLGGGNLKLGSICPLCGTRLNVEHILSCTEVFNNAISSDPLRILDLAIPMYLRKHEANKLNLILEHWSRIIKHYRSHSKTFEINDSCVYIDDDHDPQTAEITHVWDANYVRI